MRPCRTYMQRDQVLSIRPHSLVNTESLLGNLAIGRDSPVKGGPEEWEAFPAVIPLVVRKTWREGGGREGGRVD